MNIFQNIFNPLWQLCSFPTVIAGESLGVKSPVRTRTPTYFLDLQLAPGASLEQELPDEWTTFVYTLEGNVKFGERWHGKSIEKSFLSEKSCQMVFLEAVKSFLFGSEIHK